MAMKKSARHSFHISRFYVIYFAVTVAVILIIIASLGVVSNRLAEYEGAQPKYVASEVYARYFDGGVNYDALLDDAVYDHDVGSREIIKEYLINEVDGTDITYSMGSSGSAEDISYVVRAGSKQFASIVLKPKEEKTEHGYTQYEFSHIELLINPVGDTPPETSDIVPALIVTVDAPSSYSVKLDGTELTADQITQTYTRTDALPHYPSDLPDITGVECAIYTIRTLEELPESVVIADSEGTEAEVSFDADTNTYRANIVYSASLEAEYAEFVTTAIESYAAFVQRVPGTSLTKLKNSGCFDLNSDVYADIKEAAGSIWMVTKPSGNDFENVYVGEFFAFSDTVFSCHISFTQILHHNGSEDYPDPVNMYVFLHKTDDGYKIYEWYNA